MPARAIAVQYGEDADLRRRRGLGLDSRDWSRAHGLVVADSGKQHQFGWGSQWVTDWRVVEMAN